MTKIYMETSNYYKNAGSLAEKNYFSNCCGASYSPGPQKTIRPSKTKGIRVVGGIVGTERNDDKAQIAHIRTRNGDITVAIRKKM